MKKAKPAVVKINERPGVGTRLCPRCRTREVRSYNPICEDCLVGKCLRLWSKARALAGALSSKGG
jgi:hypothetical protein